MASAPPAPSPLPTQLPMVEVDVALQPGQAPVPVRVPARNAEEAFAMLITMGEGIGGAGGRHLYYGSVLEPIRDAYKARLEAVEREILADELCWVPLPIRLSCAG